MIVGLQVIDSFICEKIDAVLALYFVFVGVVIDFVIPKIDGMAEVEGHPIIEPLVRRPWLTQVPFADE